MNASLIMKYHVSRSLFRGKGLKCKLGTSETRRAFKLKTRREFRMLCSISLNQRVGYIDSLGSP